MNAQLRDNMLLTAPSLVTTDGDMVVATAVNTLKRLAAFSGDVLLHELGAWEVDISALTTNDAVGGASAGVAEIKTPVTQAEAEAGTNTRFSLWSSERVKQAIAALTTAGQIFTGSYTGDGATSKAITGVGFTVKYLRIWIRATTAAAQTANAIQETSDVIIDDNAAGLTWSVSDATTIINAIIVLGSDGFTVDDAGIDSHPNKNSQVYNYLALGA